MSRPPRRWRGSTTRSSSTTQSRPRSTIHDLNVFFSRLLFCFFAEDTGVFEKGSFTNAIGSLTASDGEDIARLPRPAVRRARTPTEERGRRPRRTSRASATSTATLFERTRSAPRFSAKARVDRPRVRDARLVADQPRHLRLDDAGGRASGPARRPRDALHVGREHHEGDPAAVPRRSRGGASTRPTRVQKLDRLLERIASIKVFDPACGSGNFLVIAYKELRTLEHRILQRLQELDPRAPLALFKVSGIKLENFYGIEIDDFAHEIAILSLWLAKHQMNVEFKELFGAEIPLIPLRDAGNIVCGNAARIDWDEVCPVDERRRDLRPRQPAVSSARRCRRAEQKADFVELLRHDRSIRKTSTTSRSGSSRAPITWPTIDARARLRLDELDLSGRPRRSAVAPCLRGRARRSRSRISRFRGPTARRATQA